VAAAEEKAPTGAGLKFTFQRGTNRCLHNGPDYDARYSCSRSMKRRCQDFRLMQQYKSPVSATVISTSWPTFHHRHLCVPQSSSASRFTAGVDRGACEGARSPTRSTNIYRLASFGLLLSRAPRGAQEPLDTWRLAFSWPCW
jgi:hypothetical protein